MLGWSFSIKANPSMLGATFAILISLFECLGQLSQKLSSNFRFLKKRQHEGIVHLLAIAIIIIIVIILLYAFGLL